MPPSPSYRPGRVLTVVPTRGRPDSAKRLILAWQRLAACSDLMLCTDDDDPAAAAYQRLKNGLRLSGLRWTAGPRQALAAWTESAVQENLDGYDAFLSLGDDHVPETEGYDLQLLNAAVQMGGGLAYGDDTLQHENLPTACLVTANVVRALGWMCLPGLQHYYIDAAWKHLGLESGQYRYLPRVTIRHLHYSAGLSVRDDTYQAARPLWGDDERVFFRWKDTRLADDARTVKEACDAAV